MTKAKRKSTSGTASSSTSDRKQKRLVSFNSAPRKSVRQKRQQPTAAEITAAVADEASQLILDRFGFENPSPPSAPPPSSKKKTEQKGTRKAIPKVSKTLATRRSPRLRKSLSLIEEADEEGEEQNYDEIIANEESSPIKPPSKRRRITPEKPSRLVVRDTFEGTPDSEEEELNQIGGEIMGMDDASWRPTTRRSVRQTPSSGQRRGRKDKKVQDNTLTQMSRDFHWNSDDEEDDDDNDQEDMTVLSPSKQPNILNLPSTPHRQIRTVIPSSRSTGTPVSILRSGGKQPRSTQVSPSKKVRWIDQEDQENKLPQPISSPIEPPSPREITNERVIPSSQWWENDQDQSLSQWDVDDVPTEDEANKAEDPHGTASADNEQDDEDESQVIDHDEIAKSNFIFSKKLQDAAECSQKELKGLSPKHTPRISPSQTVKATMPEAIPATPDVEDTPVTPRMSVQPNDELQSTVRLGSRLEVADSEGEDDENDGWEVIDEPDAVVQESQIVLASAEEEETTTTTTTNETSDLLGSSPPGAPLTPRKHVESDNINMEGSERATSPDFSIIFETQSQSNTPTQSQQLPSQVKNTGGSSQYWDLSKTNHSSGMASSSPPLPHSSFTQQGYTQWKLNKFGPTQPNVTVSQILGHSYSQDDDEEEEEDSSKVQVQSSMIGSELV